MCFVCTVESHLASNVHKSRLVQKDLQVAKKLQEEEDKRAKVQSHKQHDEMWVSLSLSHTQHLCSVYLYLRKIAYEKINSNTTHKQTLTW